MSLRNWLLGLAAGVCAVAGCSRQNPGAQPVQSQNYSATAGVVADTGQPGAAGAPVYSPVNPRVHSGPVVVRESGVAPSGRQTVTGGAAERTEARGPRYVVRERSKKKSAMIIGGGAAAGAAIGALAGGGKGAAIGALSGGGGGLIYDRLTHKKRVRVE